MNAPADRALHAEHGHSEKLATLALGALGVVYGDIGTSPLYALRESFHSSHGIEVSPANVLGVLSLVFWALIVVITIKYLTFILRADNKGEGGILALTSLVTPLQERPSGRKKILIMLGLFGTSLLYGDGVITPAISVLSAVEGIGVATPRFTAYVIPVTVVILIALFTVQRRGTAGIGKVFGPITLLWFITIATLGSVQIMRHLDVLRAINPIYGYDFFLRERWNGFLVLGSVFLVVTGGEALYADLGHFGKRPIRFAWLFVVLPALLLNYFGQGALLIADPRAVENPFYHLVPRWGLYPMVALATAATIIASQALISGAYSLTMQAVQLGYLPRVDIEHTSARTRGQIYIPGVNWLLMIGCIGLVLGFKTSSNLAAAYGVGVTTDMVITALLFFFVMKNRWRWPLAGALLLTTLFLFVDLGFWGANLHKIPHGGWFPLVVATTVFTLMTTWKRGREILTERLSTQLFPLESLAKIVAEDKVPRTNGTAIYMTRNPHLIPPALAVNLKHYHALHERIVVMVVETKETPYIAAEERVTVVEVSNNIFRMNICYGFMQEPDVPAALALAKQQGYDFNSGASTFFLGRENLIATDRPGMALWRERLFAVMARNARRATKFFNLPSESVVEVGSQVEL